MVKMYVYQLMPGARVRFVSTFRTVKSIKGTYVHGRGLLVDIDFESEVGACPAALLPPTTIVDVVEESILL